METTPSISAEPILTDHVEASTRDTIGQERTCIS